MKWKILVFFFPVATVSFSIGILGKWRPDNLSNVMIHVMDEKVVGTMDEKHSVEMEIMKQNKHEIVLGRIKLKQKPSDWFNVIKYKEYIDIFRKIREFGIVCKYGFLDEKNLEISSKIGEEEYRFLLEKILEE